MVQTYRNDENITVEPYRTYTYPWGWNVTTRNMIHWQSSSSHNVRESRPYPTDPLLSQSSQQMQERILQETAWQEKTVDGGYYDLISAEWTLPSAVKPIDTLCPWPPYENELRNKIKEEAVNLGASLAEYRQTCDMFKNLALAIVRGAKAIRKGKSPFQRDLHWRQIPSTWLMIRFGIDPLVNDIHASLEKLDKMNKSGFRKRFKVKAKDRLETADRNSLTLDWSKDDVSIRASVWVIFKENPASFTLGNPAELAWELTPFSWLIDYVIGIGDYLSALDALSEVADLRGTVTKKRKYTSGTNIKSYGPLTGAQRHYEGTHTYESHQRDLFTWIPMGRIPFKESISGGKILNALSALLLLKK